MATTTTTTNYGVPVALSIKKGVKSEYRNRPGLAYPLTQNRTVVVTSDLRKSSVPHATYFGKAIGLSLIKNNLNQLLRTERGERVMLPDYGLSLKKYLFEPLDETTFELIKSDILGTLRKYFSIGRVLNLSVLGGEKATSQGKSEENKLFIKLTIQLLDESLDIFDIEAKVG